MEDDFILAEPKPVSNSPVAEEGMDTTNLQAPRHCYWGGSEYNPGDTHCYKGKVQRCEISGFWVPVNRKC